MKQTAVEWLVEQINNISIIDPAAADVIQDILQYKEQAKEMEKEQIGKAFLNGRIKEIGQGVLFDLKPLIETFDNYYNKTFKSE
jgi:hypothetical protein